MSESRTDEGAGTARETFEITVDGEEISTSEHELTPRQIMELAGIDPESHYLVELRGNHQISYEGRLDEPIHIHQHQRFVSNSSGPTPVS